MAIIVDTHVHIYPEYDVVHLLSVAAQRLWALQPAATPALCLVEREGQHVFADWAAAHAGGDAAFVIERIDGGGGMALCVTTPTGPLYVLPGRQIATAERLEVLALGRDLNLKDGTPAADLTASIREAGGIPVLPWAFGKWWFKRAHKVRNLLQQCGPQQLWLGDTTMRPREWWPGTIMRQAIAAGRGVLAGSDPLPGAAESAYAGRYATLLDGELDPADPAGSILNGLRSLPPGGRTLGRRDTLLAVLFRMVRCRR